MCMVLEGADQDAQLACMLFSDQDEGINLESLVEKATVAPSQVMPYFIIFADAETTNVRLDCVAGMCHCRKRIIKYIDYNGKRKATEKMQAFTLIWT